jgi:hypothetical protein
MGATLIGFLVGMVLGSGSGSMGIAMLGGVLGAMTGALAHATIWLYAHSGNRPIVATHRVLCTPYGQAADITFEGDLDRGRWTDVKRCSLLPVVGRVECDKRCVRRMNEAGVRPGDDCSCGAHATA